MPDRLSPDDTSRTPTDDEVRAWNRSARLDAAWLWFFCLGLPTFIVVVGVYAEEILLGLGAAVDAYLDLVNNLLLEDNT